MTPSTITRPVTDEQLWFLDTLVTVRVPHATGDDGMSVIESLAPFGEAPPLHIHHTEDELFEVLEGELLRRVGDQDISAPAGAVLLAPRPLPSRSRPWVPCAPNTASTWSVHRSHERAVGGRVPGLGRPLACQLLMRSVS